ncbi:MAG: DMT family transporter [Microvirga sp.]|nr:DMT family transporter [Microvirga sp.]
MKSQNIDIDASDPAERRQRLVAIGLMNVALFCFCCLDAGAKWLGSQGVDPLMTVFARYAVAVALVSLFVNHWTTPGVMRTSRLGLQILRSLLLFGSSVLTYNALRYVQLAEMSAIMFATPFLVALFAGPMLGERVGPRRMAAICVGFVGVLIVVRPGLGGLHPAALLIVGAAICYSFYGILTRMLAASDSSRTTLVYSGLAGVALMAPIMPFVWTAPESALVWAMMGFIGLAGGFGHWLLILAHARAPAPVLSPFIYGQIVWMLILGYVIFGELPDIWTLAGAGVVIASGLYLLYRERARGIIPR